MSQARQEWIDYAKGIGILLVVYGHTARGLMSAGIASEQGVFHLLDSIIYSFHMPLFLFLSGLLFHHSLQRHGPGQVVLNKMDTILYPYVLWSILQGTVEVVLARYTNGNVTFADVFNLFEPRAQFWFLYALFLVMVLGALVYSRLKERHFLPVAAVAALVFVSYPYLPEPWKAEYLFYSFVFFACGVWFNTWKGPVLKHADTLLLPSLLLFVGGQWLFHVHYGKHYLHIGFGLLALALTSILFVVLLSSVLSRYRLRWLLCIGYSSMGIFLMHVLAGSGARVLLQKFLHVDEVGIHLFVGILVAALLPVALLKFFKRFGWGWLFEAPVSASGFAGLRRRART